VNGVFVRRREGFLRFARNDGGGKGGKVFWFFFSKKNRLLA